MGTTIGGPFSLMDASGQIVTTQTYHGRFMLIFFGYTACPDECPLALEKIAQALAILHSPPARLAALFITIDPAHDTPALAGRYAALFSPAITGLSGSPAQIAQAVADYHVYVGPRDPQTGAIAHSALVYFMGPDGAFITAFPPDMPAGAMAEAISGK